MASRYSILSLLVFISWSLQSCLVLGGGGDPPRGQLKIVYAVNAGGKTHEDVHGIVYLQDPSDQGVASDFGMRMNIDRVHPNDQILYQTERYSPSTFGYDIPVKDDGNYVLVLKFSEVYFRQSGAKVFDVILNSKHRVVEDLDIFGNVGFANAYDVYVPFIVTDHAKKLIVDRASSSPIRGNRIRVDFVKGSADNPKVNAFYVAKGNMQDIPQLPPAHLYNEEEEYEEDEREQVDDDGVFYGDDDEEEIQFSRSDLGAEGSRKLPIFQGGQLGRRRNYRSGPASDDPWELESPVVIYMPLFASIAASVVSFWFLRIVNQKL